MTTVTDRPAQADPEELDALKRRNRWLTGAVVLLAIALAGQVRF